jgi:glutathione synthase/RimK-type ligase-like ATP-grasp enzyme
MGIVKVKSAQPQILLLASRYDLTCDYVVSQLRRRYKIKYLRLNSEDLSDSTVELDPIRRCLKIECGDKNYVVTPDCLRSVLFRRPVFLREYGEDNRSSADKFSRLQWAAFMRNLLLFHEARWINDPVATYRAEHKAVQISVATQLGFTVPETRVTNAPHPDLLSNGYRNVALKGLDTVLLRANGQEMFGFTTFECAAALEPTAWRSAPATIQTALMNKLDIRVTVVEDQVFAASITANGYPISGDWRTKKADTNFSKYNLPEDTSIRCRRLVKLLGLRFGCIDLALQDGVYYFLEVNPTGEWAWLVDAAGLPIDTAIADALVREASVNVR